MQNLYKGVQVMSSAGNLEYSYPLFDTFWNNTGLRGSLFENMDEEEAKSNFISLVGNLNSSIYSFIEIK